MTAEHEILEVAKKIRMDLTGLQAKLSELMRLAALLEPADPRNRLCPECSLFVGSLPQGCTLADHRYRAHGVELNERRVAA